ncbi:reverse transcriptase domain-containing protein [Tanacetum coccineum]
MDAMTMKMDAKYKEFQSRSKQPNPDHNDDDKPMHGGLFYPIDGVQVDEVKMKLKGYNKWITGQDENGCSVQRIPISEDEDEESTPQPKSQTPKPVKETLIPKPYKPKIPYPQRLRKEKIEAQYGMPNSGKFLKELVSNKHKLEQISSAFLSDESSAMIQNKVPPKHGDPESFLIPCNFSKAFSCNALADLAKNMLIEVGKFTFPIDFIILEMEEDSKVPLILGRPFLYTADAILRVKQKQFNLGVGTERITFLINSVMKHSYLNDDTCFNIDVIDEILEEDFDVFR